MMKQKLGRTRELGLRVFLVLAALQLILIQAVEGRSLRTAYADALAETERQFDPPPLQQALMFAIGTLEVALVIEVSRKVLRILPPAGTFRYDSTACLSLAVVAFYFTLIKVIMVMLVLVEMVSEDVTGIRPFGLPISARTRVEWTQTIVANATLG